MNNDAELNRKLFLATTEKKCHECSKFKSKITGYKISNFWCRKNRNVVSGCDRLTKLMNIIKNHNDRIELDRSLKNLNQTIENIITEVCKRKPIMHKPKRDTIINQEDIQNLKIALGTSKTITEFCRKV